MENAGSDAQFLPSVTRIWIFEYVPTLADDGVPTSVPVAPSKRAHAGRLPTRNDRVGLSGSVAVGRNKYVCPTVTPVGGVPLIVGGLPRVLPPQLQPA